MAGTVRRSARVMARGSRESRRKPLALPEGPKQCSICLEDISILGRLPVCSHRFCFTCIFKWSERTNRCPLCKKRFRCISKISLANESPMRQVRIPDRDQQQEISDHDNSSIVLNFMDYSSSDDFDDDSFIDDSNLSYSWLDSESDSGDRVYSKDIPSVQLPTPPNTVETTCSKRNKHRLPVDSDSDEDIVPKFNRPSKSSRKLTDTTNHTHSNTTTHGKARGKAHGKARGKARGKNHGPQGSSTHSTSTRGQWLTARHGGTKL